MRLLAFRFLVACFTFYLGIASSSLLVIKKRPSVSSMSGQTFSMTKPRAEIKLRVLSDKLKKVGDLPAQDKFDFWNRIQFISEKDGWFKAAEKLWRTEDGGKTWKLIFDGGVVKIFEGSSQNEPDSIYDFQFISTRVGWVLQDDKMFKTEDGGKTWKPFAQSLVREFDSSSKASLLSHACTFKFLPDGKHGWIAGGSYRRLKEGEDVPNRFYSLDGNKGQFGTIFTTQDGGMTWKKQLLPGCGDIGELFFLDAEHAWAVGTAGAYHLKNGRWVENETEAVDKKGNSIIGSLDIAIGVPTTSPDAVYFVNSQLGWLSNSNGYLAKSTDGGRTWQDIVNLRDEQYDDWPMLFLHKLYFGDSLHGWALDSQRRLRHTSDGGATWKKIESDVEFTDIYFVDAWNGWALSGEGLFRIRP